MRVATPKCTFHKITHWKYWTSQTVSLSKYLRFQIQWVLSTWNDTFVSRKKLNFLPATFTYSWIFNLQSNSRLLDDTADSDPILPCFVRCVLLVNHVACKSCLSSRSESNTSTERYHQNLNLTYVNIHTFLHYSYLNIRNVS